MKTYKKSLTKSCPSCEFLEIEDNDFICKIGKAKRPKILIKTEGKAKFCNLTEPDKRKEEKKKRANG